MPKGVYIRRKEPLADRLMRRVRYDGGCWTWSGSRDCHGYGRIRVNGRSASAHRIAFAELVGPLIDGLDIDHLCRNRACINPLHLEQVTRSTNLRRGRGRRIYEKVG